jgi:RNA polymerase sigma-70 factor (ECF subfamily)
MDGTDAEVMEASWDDPSVFAEVFHRYYPTVFAYVMRTVGHPDGPDVAAEVFVEAFRSRRRYDTSYPSARGWLLGIAAHLVGTHYRRKARLRRVPADEAMEGDFADEVAERVDASRSTILTAMGRLRPAEREILSLFVFADLSYREIAQALGIAQGTVRSRLNRARTKLRNLTEFSNEHREGGREAPDA